MIKRRISLIGGELDSWVIEVLHDEMFNLTPTGQFIYPSILDSGLSIMNIYESMNLFNEDGEELFVITGFSFSSVRINKKLF